jgi:hypothetical protein
MITGPRGSSPRWRRPTSTVSTGASTRPTTLPSRACPADGVTVPARLRSRAEPDRRDRPQPRVIEATGRATPVRCIRTEGVCQGGAKGCGQGMWPRDVAKGCEGVLPAGFLPLPPWLDQGTWPGRDLPRASGRARIYPRIRVLTRGSFASLPEVDQLCTVMSMHSSVG